MMPARASEPLRGADRARRAAGFSLRGAARSEVRGSALRGAARSEVRCSALRGAALRVSSGLTRRAPAFTLTEMLVALAVMVLALAVVTSVFSVTTKTAATSAAIADVQTLVRNFAYQLQQDLEHCDPARSILVIHGRTQAAALTEELRQAGQYYRVMVGDPQVAEDSGFDPRFDVPADPNANAYSDPRADILMFFTNRPTASRAPATSPGALLNLFQDRLRRGAKVAPIQVVYGHAALAEPIRTSGGWQFPDDRELRHIESTDPATVISRVPANRWHLSRRQALIDPNSPNADFQWDNSYPRVWRCYSDPAREAGQAADSVRFNFPLLLEEFGPHTAGDMRPNVALLSPYGFSPDAPPEIPGGLRWTGMAGVFRDYILRMLYPYGDDTYHHVATVIERPPAELADNLGVHLLPGCVWFGVEILIPEDPRNGLDSPLSDQRRDTPRWVPIEPGQTYVFVPDTDENRKLVEAQALADPTNVDRLIGTRIQTFKKLVPGNADLPGYDGPDTVENRRVRMWPYGIRVTVRVIDQRGRLERPIVRSVVHRFD